MREADLQTGTDFAGAFAALTGHPPMPWQEALYLRFLAGDIPDVANLPTGLGKTNVLACWLIALSNAPERVPRRLVYVVNRRTVVDQATSIAERIRVQLDHAGLTDRLAALCALPHETPLAVSTLRGRFADNAAWRRDPSRPAIVIGTVDMVGSRLLFSGYGASFRTRPMMAAFLGQDSLIVHDEAHLEPAFQALIESIRAEQIRSGDLLPIHVLALTATPRTTSVGAEFTLSDNDLEHPVVRQRIHARKSLHVHVADDKDSQSLLLELALRHRGSGDAVVVFVRTLDSVQSICAQLVSAGIPEPNVTSLTGTMRGHERDLQLDPSHPGADPVFTRFLRLPPDVTPQVEPVRGTAYLVSTSAGEVGVDISADHMVTDLTTFDAMAQRLGRVNRYGTRSAQVDVVASASQLVDEHGRYHKTVELLRSLNGDASPAALQDLAAAERIAAYAPPPALLPATDILFDAWALTTLRDRLPGRPPVAGYLHGITADADGPRTYVAWRREVDELADLVPVLYSPEDLLASYPLKPHEYLSDRSYRVLDALKQLAKRTPDGSVWILDTTDKGRAMRLSEAASLKVAELANCFVILGPLAGGLRRGMLDPDAEFSGDWSEDVADLWGGEQGVRRMRRFADTEHALDGPGSEVPGMRLVRRIDIPASEEEEVPARVWLWYVRRAAADDVSSSHATASQIWQDHTDAVRDLARDIAAQRLPDPFVRVVELAGLAHDLGKRRELWQRGIGNPDYPAVTLAKAPIGAVTLRHHYRHELGSLTDLNAAATLPQDGEAHIRELVLHLVAAHHGRGRPSFPAREQIDPEAPKDAVSAICAAVPERFGRLQWKYGRWGLAYLESVLRAADYIVSEDA